ncbi:MAG TPA: nucleotidyltransferase family protein [Niallia sp.]|uniref:nucleotidyltransferase domain-containing protein n=1 Tax=Bacillus sp. J37 TaxID=935837 RepID=UPI00047B6935|nr:nucleotidyltransferase family protein [Bacillus sp. J37]HWJ76735.1 nucleotidyltransferase family protein [Niallia sp.]
MQNQVHLNLANVPEELKVILEIIKKNTVNRDLFMGIDWDHFIEQSMHHRVYPVLHSILIHLDKGIIPTKVMNHLSVQYKRNTFNMLYLSSEMERISKFYTEDNIRLLFLKGPVIAHDLYGDVSLRTSSDLDFLISIEDLEKAEAILIKQGYEKVDYIETVLNDWKWRHHHVTYFHPLKRMKAEIHWRLNPGPGVEPKFEQLWNRKLKSELTNYPVYFLGKEDLFLFLVSHGARHGWSRLRWLLDIHQLTEQQVNWKKVNELLKIYQFHKAGAQALALTSELLGSHISAEMMPILANKHSQKLAQEAIFYFEKMVNLHTDPVPEEVFRYHSRHLFSLMSLKQKIWYALSILHPLPEDADALPLPKKLHFLYFPLRPFIWAWRRVRKHALP